MAQRLKRLIKWLVIRSILVLPFGTRILDALKPAYRTLKVFVRAYNPYYRGSVNPEDYLRLGQILVQERLLDRAVEQFGRAIQLAPCASKGYALRGHAFQELGQPTQAHKDFEIALALPDATTDERRTVHARLSSVLVDLGEIDQALFHFYTYLMLQRTGKSDGDRFQPGLVPDSAEKLQTLIESHDHVAEHVINHQSDFEVASGIYARKRRLQEHFAAAFGLADARMLFLPDDWVRNVGHVALLDFWVKMHYLGWRTWDQRFLIAPAKGTANEAYVRYWKKHFTVLTDPHLIGAVTPFATALGSHVACMLQLPDGQEKYFCEGMGVIQEEWEKQGRGPLLELTAEDRRQGWETLAALGVPEGSWFVCLHVRSPGFHKEGDNGHQVHRNADVHSYLPAIRAIVARGGWVVRLGDPSMEPLPPLPGLIDYAHSPSKSAAMDVFLCASCRFFIGVASGLSHVPTTFGVPCALTNWVSNAFPVYGTRDRFLPKLTWSNAGDRILGFEEALEPEVRKLNYCGLKLEEHKLRAVDNTPEELVELVEEMFEILDGSVAYTAADEDRQRTFREVALGYGLVGFSRIGRTFLRKYAHLLPQHHQDVPLAG